MITIDWEVIIADCIERLIPIAFLILSAFILRVLNKAGARDEHKALVSDALTIIERCVLATKQKLVDGLKAEGKFDKAAQKMVYDECMKDVNLLLSDSMKLALEATYGSLEKVLEILVEANVATSK